MKSAQVTTISMRTETLLVIFEFLARSYEDWRKSGVAPARDLSDESFVLSKPDSGERVALWRLEGEIERTLPELFSPDYLDLIAEEKRCLTQELYGPDGGDPKLTLWGALTRMGRLSRGTNSAYMGPACGWTGCNRVG